MAVAPSFGDTNLASLLGSSIERGDSEAATLTEFAFGGESDNVFSASSESSTRSKAFCFLESSRPTLSNMSISGSPSAVVVASGGL
jgi:hypothetical protein